MGENENLGALRQTGFSKIVAAAYDQLVRDMLEQSAAFSKQYKQWREEENARWAAKWAKMSRREKLRWHVSDKTRRAKRQVRKWWNDGRWWLSNLIYKHEECDPR